MGEAVGGYSRGCGVGGSTGAILVLFILLVIITSAFCY
ncbi:sporulation protein YjcZ [Paenibacillus sp. IHBB 10380]|nr:sporulation protein YjcZ [Paenibacillus sp. IHBB 10380]